MIVHKPKSADFDVNEALEPAARSGDSFQATPRTLLFAVNGSKRKRVIDLLLDDTVRIGFALPRSGRLFSVGPFNATKVELRYPRPGKIRIAAVELPEGDQ